MQVSVASSGPQGCDHLAWWIRSRSGAGFTRINYRTRRTAGRPRERPGAGALREGGCCHSGLVGWALLLGCVLPRKSLPFGGHPTLGSFSSGPDEGPDPSTI